MADYRRSRCPDIPEAYTVQTKIGSIPEQRKATTLRLPMTTGARTDAA